MNLSKWFRYHSVPTIGIADSETYSQLLSRLSVPMRTKRDKKLYNEYFTVHLETIRFIRFKQIDIPFHNIVPNLSKLITATTAPKQIPKLIIIDKPVKTKLHISKH